MAEHLNDTNFSEIMSQKDWVLVDFWAPWCGPCRALTPTIDAISASMTSLDVVKVNVDDAPQISTQYQIQSIPTLILFHKGQAKKTQVGSLTEAELRQWIQDTISSAKTE